MTTSQFATTYADAAALLRMSDAQLRKATTLCSVWACEVNGRVCHLDQIGGMGRERGDTSMMVEALVDRLRAMFGLGPL